MVRVVLLLVITLTALPVMAEAPAMNRHLDTRFKQNYF